MDNPTPVTRPVDDEIDLRDLVGIVWAGRWLLIAVGSIVLLLAALFAWVSPRVYSADALVQVELEEKSIDAALGEMAELLGSQTPITAEIEIIRSRFLIGTVVDELNLQISTQPNYFPLIGRPMARGYASSAEEPVASAPFGADRFAWGGEDLEVTRLDVGDALVDKPLTLTATESGFSLANDDGEILSGQVGTLATGTTENGPVAIFVQDLRARPGTEFTVTKNDRISVITAIAQRLSVAERGKDSGILSVSFQDSHPELAHEIVNALVTAYQRQNVERKSAEAQQTLTFMQAELPRLKQQLETSEDSLNQYRLRQGSADLTKETELVLQQSVQLETDRMQLQQRKEEMSERFTAQHPVIAGIDAQLAQITSAQRSLESRVKALPETQQELLRLSRDVEVNQALYVSLLNSSQELQIAKAGTVGNVRVIDLAYVPSDPSKPNVPLILVAGVVLGGMLGIVAIFVRRAMHSGIEDPAVVEDALGLPTYASVPYSPKQQRLWRGVESGSAPASLLAIDSPGEVAVEALRGLRTALHFALLEARSNVVMLTGPAPGVGKSFITSNLGAVLAASGKRVLVIDADMRRGQLHKYYNVNREPGLSELVAGAATLESVIKSTAVDGLFVISTGSIPPNPAELLMHDRFNALIEGVQTQYDYVLVDTPPVLAVTDAAIVGPLVGCTLLVLKAGDHPLRAIEETVRRLQTVGVSIRGTLFNQVGRSGTQGYGYGYGRYNYQYEYKSRTADA